MSEQNKEMIYNNNNNNNNNVSCGDFITVTSAQPQRGLAFLRRCFFTGETVTGGLGNHPERLLGVSSLTLALNSRIALCLCVLRVVDFPGHSFAPDPSQTRTNPPAQILFGDAMCR